MSILAVALASFLPTLVIHLSGWPTGWRTIGNWLHREALDDSWRPIRDALHYLADHGPAGLYEQTYWHSSHQFIYSPLSIVFYKVTNFPPFLEWLYGYSLNRFSWWIVLATVAITPLVFEALARRVNPDAGPTSTTDCIAKLVVGVIATLTFYPIMYAYSIGQIQTWLNFLLILSLLLWLRDYRFPAGMAVGLVCTIKPNLSLILLWALLRREHHFAIGFLGIVVPLALASLLMFGLPVHLEYLKLMAFLSERGEAFYSNHAINGLLNRMIFNGNNLEWDGTHTQIHYVAWVHYATVISSLCIILPTFLRYRPSGAIGAWLDFAIALVSYTIASPVAYEIHFGYTLPIFFMVLCLLLQQPRPARLELWTIGISYSLCANYLSPTQALAETHLNFLQSYMLAGTLLLLVLLYRLRSAAATPSPIPAVPARA